MDTFLFLELLNSFHEWCWELLEKLSFRMALLGLVLCSGVALSRFSRYLKMPILICFLAVGSLCGKYGLNMFPLLTITRVQMFGEIALCFIIFSGGLTTSFKSVKEVFVTGTILSTGGVILTAFVTGACIYFFSNALDMFPSQPFLLSLLSGAVISSTDAAAVFAILRGQKAKISPRLQGLLEYESGSNDPSAFLLTTILLGLVLSGISVDYLRFSWEVIYGIIWGLGVAVAVGLLIGVAGQWFYGWLQSFLEYNGLRLVVAVAIVFVCCGIADSLFHVNVLMACYAAGITMGNMRFTFKQTFIKFHDGISWLMQILLFTSLGCFFNFRMLFSCLNILGALLLSFFVMFLIRPLVVLLCMTGSPFSFRERLFTGWVGIRGSAPIMLAALVMSKLSDRLPNLFSIVFTTVLFSILLQGSTIVWVAKKLKLLRPYEEQEEALIEYDERSDGREMVECKIADDNPLVGHPYVRPGNIPQGIVLLMFRRNNAIFSPTPEKQVQSGDILTFLGTREELKLLHDLYFPTMDYTMPMTFRQICNRLSMKVKNRRKITTGKLFRKSKSR